MEQRKTLEKVWRVARRSLCAVACWAMGVLCLLPTGCRKAVQLTDENAVYYWRTEWRLDSTEAAFLREHDINKVYCRYFDVVMDDATGEPVPNATIAFGTRAEPVESTRAEPVESTCTPIPAGLEIVPTVYITEDCMHATHDGLARKLVQRVVQMNATHDIDGVSELQIDCDYTLNSRRTFYAFLEEVRSEARRHGLRLSATIRLHQLSMPVPPVDYGVLMLYNTGDPQRFDERNPVLDQRDVQPYVRYLDGYDLPLAAAYPVYAWQRTIHGVRIEHVVEAEEILAVKKMVETRRDDLRHTILTFCLDTENIQRYNTATYEAIYHH